MLRYFLRIWLIVSIKSAYVRCFLKQTWVIAECPPSPRYTDQIYAHIAALDSVSVYSRQLTRMRIAQVVLDFSKKLKAMQKDLHSNCK